jgi:hypothetical protein
MPLYVMYRSLACLLPCCRTERYVPQLSSEVEPRHYLAIDTNVLIDHLSLVRALYALLRETGERRVGLLVPSVVINGGSRAILIQYSIQCSLADAT